MVQNLKFWVRRLGQLTTPGLNNYQTLQECGPTGRKLKIRTVGTFMRGDISALFCKRSRPAKSRFPFPTSSAYSRTKSFSGNFSKIIFRKFFENRFSNSENRTPRWCKIGEGALDSIKRLVCVSLYHNTLQCFLAILKYPQKINLFIFCRPQSISF